MGGLPGLQKIFKLNQIYLNPVFVRLFSSSDNTDRNVYNKKILKNGLTTGRIGKYDVNLDPTRQNQFGCQTILELLQSGEFQLEFNSLFGIWFQKLFNTDGEHFLDFVVTLGLLNFCNHKGQGTKTILGKEIDVLTDDMEKTRHSYSLMFLGLCLHMLINDRAVSIKKKPYWVQEYLQKLLFGTNKNRNEVMYSIVYDRKLEFFSVKSNRTHSITIRCIFDIFRIKLHDRDQTIINMSSCYPRGFIDKLKYVWAKDDTLVDFSSLLPNKQIEYREAEKQKYNYMKDKFREFSVFDTLKQIFPNFRNDLPIQNYLKHQLQINSFEYDEVIKLFDEIITWPLLEQDQV